jgi:hypothetical protein
MNNCDVILKWFGTLGLVLDIIGVLLIYLYGIPNDLNAKGLIYKVCEGTDEDEVKKYKKCKRRSDFGLILVLIGFVFQLISSINSIYAK